VSFTRTDFDELSALMLDGWAAAVDLDWSVRAGPVEWSCLRTAEHVIDCVFSYALFLASGKQDGYPRFGELAALDGAGPSDMVDGLRAVTTMLSAVIAAAPADRRAVIWRRPTITLGSPDDFAARGGLELILHASDIAAGLGVALAPDAERCRRLYETTGGWPGTVDIDPTGDPWNDLLSRSGRPFPPRH
jgi:hypothetical protein